MSAPNEPSASAADAITTPQKYRELRPAVDSFRLVTAALTVTMLGPRRARYQYTCHLHTVGPVLARYWCYHIPAERTELADLRAWDERGKLSARLLAGDGPGTRLEIRLRQPVKPGEHYTFSYGYEASVGTVVARDGTRRVVTFSDWVIFNIPCDELAVTVELPKGARTLTTVPVATDIEPERITWRARDLRPLETMNYMLAFRVSIHRPGYRRLAAAFASALAREPDDFTELPRGW